jgi:hypothetical protein
MRRNIDHTLGIPLDFNPYRWHRRQWRAGWREVTSGMAAVKIVMILDYADEGSVELTHAA